MNVSGTGAGYLYPPALDGRDVYHVLAVVVYGRGAGGAHRALHARVRRLLAAA